MVIATPVIPASSRMITPAFPKNPLFFEINE